METRKVNIWKPIAFSKNWEDCRTIRLDAILPSWTKTIEHALKFLAEKNHRIGSQLSAFNPYLKKKYFGQ